MPFSVDSLLTDTDWIPMSLEGQQESPTYFWEDGGLLKDSPVDFDATFAENMLVSTKPIQFLTFYRNPLKVVPNFTVPRHLHNIDETIIVFKGEYKIEYGDPADGQYVIVKPGCFFTSRAGTPYTMTAGPEGVTYIETWGTPVTSLKTVWYDFGWVRKYGKPRRGKREKAGAARPPASRVRSLFLAVTVLAVTRQERQHGALELVLALDHRPVPAVVEHVQLALGDEPHGGERAVHRRHPVVAAEHDQRRRLDLGQHRDAVGGAERAALAHPLKHRPVVQLLDVGRGVRVGRRLPAQLARTRR